MPQGSVLGHLLFSCYMMLLEDKLEELGIKYFLRWWYRSFFCIRFDPQSMHVWFFLPRFNVGSAMQNWNWMRIRVSMIIWKCKIVKHGLLRLLESVDYTEQVKVLGCYIDCQLTLQRQVKFVCSSSFYYLHKVWSIRDQVKTSVLIELIRILVLSRGVDYCNCLYYGLPNCLLTKLQRIMNAAACLIFRLSPSTPTSSYLKQLHWLQIRQRIVFKILLYAHRFVH